MPTRTDTIVAARRLLQIPNVDQEIYDSDIYDTIIQNALLEFSRVKPRRIPAAYYGNSEYNRELPSGFTEGQSVIYDIKPNVGQGRSPLDPNSYYIVWVDKTEFGVATIALGATSFTLSTVANARYFKKGDVIRIKEVVGGTDVVETNWVSADGNATTGVVTLKNAAAVAYDSTPTVRMQDHIRFLASTPIATERFTVEYSGIHTHDEDTDTILAIDYGAFTYVVAAITAYALSAKFSLHTDPSFDADTVDYGSKQQHWADVGARYYDLFLKHFGVSAGGTVGSGTGARPGGANADLDLRPLHPFGYSFNYNNLR